MKNDLMAKARVGLICDQPFFASILLPMPMIEAPDIPTLETNGEVIRYNPEFIKTLSLGELTFVLAHETMHCVFQHMTRRGNRNPNKWNQAGDYVINDVLVREKVGVMPAGGLHNPGLVAQGGGTTEGVYGLLPEENEQKGPGMPGGAMDNVTDAGQDEAEMSQKEAEMRVKIVQAKNAAKMQGKMSAGLERLVHEMIQTRTDWRAVLRRFLSDKAKIDLSYAKPKRRWLADDLYLPSLTGEKLGMIAVAVDGSGSIGQGIVDLFAGELNAIVEDTTPAGVRLLWFDAAILSDETIGPEAYPIVLKPLGGGGTRFSPIFKALQNGETPIVACIILTDLECNDFGPAPDFPVLWASTDKNGKAPFGEVLHIQEDN